MKNHHSFWTLCVMAVMMLWVSQAVQANDYLEQKKHYSTRVAGADCIHFVIPVWAYGAAYDYYTLDESYVYYQLTGSSDKTVIANHKSERYGENESDNGRGSAWMNLREGQGEIVVTSMASGVNFHVTAGAWTDKLIVQQRADDSSDQVTFLEFDWYPPQELNDTTFTVGVRSVFDRSYSQDNRYDKTFELGSYKGAKNEMTPQLYTPYLYQVSATGMAGYGYAAIPYSTFYATIGYTMKGSDEFMKNTNRSDNLYVMTTDTVQEEFYATFREYRNEELGTTMEQQSTVVDIPAYHRIYQFDAIEELDSTHTYTGNIELHWDVKNPNLRDLVDGDYFEVQRALRSDYSDAQTLKVVALARGEDKGHYSIVDDSRETWSGNADISHTDSMQHRVSTTIKDYALRDTADQVIAVIDMHLTSDSLISPGVDVYYRIRRASASVWGWDHEFAQTLQLSRHNFLAPLADEQAPYTKDDAFEQNHKVHFAFTLENKEVHMEIPEIKDCSFSYEIKHDASQDITLDISVSSWQSSTLRSEVYLTLYDASGAESKAEWQVTESESSIPAQRDGMIKIRYKDKVPNADWKTKTFDLTSSSQLKIEESSYNPMVYGYQYFSTQYSLQGSGKVSPDIDARVREVESSLKQQLWEQLSASIDTTLGRCMWDRTARVVLVRSSEETPDAKMEIIVPQDSIVRQADGSWRATITDVADHPCTHYTYAVRIDQSTSDLHVQDSAQLKPIVLSGPSLYYDNAAEIVFMTATQGAIETAYKPGVMLTWEPSSNAVDEYVLERKEKDSSASADTVFHGVEATFFDDTAVPNVQYEYTVTARYSCNGKHSENSRTISGWRTPYGEISGQILMPDNSGMAGITVALQDSTGNSVRTLVTDASGWYKFDSLDYGYVTNSEVKSMDYVVVPQDEHAVFSFNNTSAGTAAISLSADNAVAQHIDFANTNSVRITGRALYELSTVPVAGAMLLLNGDTVRRGDTPLTTGTDGNFELAVTKDKTYTLQMFKPGHRFVNDGYLEVKAGQREFALDKPLDGVRFYDQTKVRLAGRVAGGNDQRDLPTAFGLGNNNLGDDLMLVLQLEGDNTAQLIHDPDDLSRDTLLNVYQQIVYSTDSLTTEPERIVGTTMMYTQKKRIIIYPDVVTGEYVVDLFPTKYKVVQATARGYATLFASGEGMTTFDLTNAPLVSFDPKQDADSVHYNAVFDHIYHAPVQVHLRQMLNGMEQKGFGEKQIEVSSFDPNQHTMIDLYTPQLSGDVVYVLGYPLFYTNHKYQFAAEAYEEYFYNNSRAQKIDRVPWRGGEVIVRNGLESQSATYTYPLDNKGRNSSIYLPVDYIDVETIGTSALRSISVALKTEGNVVESESIRGFVIGSTTEWGEMETTDTNIQLLDVIRDPGGAGSSSYVEKGTTYSFNYTSHFDLKLGVILSPTFGSDVNMNVGVYVGAPGNGTYTGQTISAQSKLSYDLPIIFKWDNGYEFNYSFTTSDRISTSSEVGPAYAGSNADVFVGATLSRVIGKIKTIAVINDSLFQARQPAIQSGAMLLLASGQTMEGDNYYLVTGEKIAAGMFVNNTFAYSQYYIMETLIPRLIMQRYNLLMQFNDSASAKAAANAAGEPVYWYHKDDADQYDKYYTMVLPDGGDVFTDQVAAVDNIILSWAQVVAFNEQEKVEARTKGELLGTYSVSDGASLNHSDSYSVSAGYNEVPFGAGTLIAMGKQTAEGAGTALMTLVGRVLGGIANNNKIFATTLGKSAAEALNDFYKNGNENEKKNAQEIGTMSNGWGFSMNYTPVVDMNIDPRWSNSAAQNRSHGYTIKPDPRGNITISVYRARLDSTWKAISEEVLEAVQQKGNEDLLYGNYVFYTVAGSTYCPHEDEERTQYYNPGTVLNNGTLWVHKPEMTSDTYEKTNIDPSTRATFRVTLMNNSELDTGFAATEGAGFYLQLDGVSNPDGAKVFVNGAPLGQSFWYWLTPGTPVTQTVEIERGTADDYDIVISLYLADCPKTSYDMHLAVHFLPESSPVEIAMPRQNWVMNTLSPRDSTGYYLPVEINGFDLHYKNFDHIEFQYKLSSESDEKWVNQCSFYANDTLYEQATGNKAMIENGKITPFRFYGEKDPMEQRYDLRAVTFCRYGSGYVHHSSPVISGIKDTRPPRVFGEPEPANSILSVGDNLLLRFNEAIAGNYLDEDNNFRIVGVTNETGIATSTSLQFDGSASSAASTKVGYRLTNMPFTIDMMVKPAEPNTAGVFFSHGAKGQGVVFGITQDNRLYVQQGNSLPIYSKAIEDPILAFTRVVLTSDDINGVHFYVGTADYTDPDQVSLMLSDDPTPSPLVFGQGFAGDMLEARVWSKVLTPEEITATNNHYLTGYERELLAYYHMNEGKGAYITDNAHGATLYLNGSTWNKKTGYSLALNGEQVKLDGNLLGRSTAYDETLMFWFKTDGDGTLFSANRTEPTDSVAGKGTRIAIEQGALTLYNDNRSWTASDNFAADEWHHFVLTISRTYDMASLFVDGQLYRSFAAAKLSGITGAMYLGGNGFVGHIDEFAILEQALPRTLIESSDNMSFVGDEMGLVGYLPFEEQYLNASGVLDQRFTVNDKRIITDAEGNVIDKKVPLVLGAVTESMQDATQNAPVTDHGQLTKLRFDWAFNNDELMVNLLNSDYEINKQSIYITVRDVEDMNGNPMTSPVTWTAFVDRNSLKWSAKSLQLKVESNLEPTEEKEIRIVNHSGKRHNFTIESLPYWLTVDESSGAVEPMGEITLLLTFNRQVAVGEYNDIIYLTDGNGLSEPLRIDYTVEAVPPYGDVDRDQYPFNMSVCGQVMLRSRDGKTTFDTDSRDIVYALYRNECVGQAPVMALPSQMTNNFYLTVMGNDDMVRKELSYQLWQASTGKVFDLKPSTPILFAHGYVYGCGDTDPVIFTTTGSEMQEIALNKGWNWISTNLHLIPEQAPLDAAMSAAAHWTEGDLIKNPADRLFSTYSEKDGMFVGTLAGWDFHQMYMFFVANENTIRLGGDNLAETDKQITLHGDGQWNAFPCLLSEVTEINEAMADYFANATPGDIVKAHNRFAVFTTDQHWFGDLTALRPGEGYLMRRMGLGTVTMKFYDKPATNKTNKKVQRDDVQSAEAFTNTNAATNMTMIAATIVESEKSKDESLRVYVGDELAGVATPMDSLYFLTIQSDKVGKLRFETEDGTELRPYEIDMEITYEADSHVGSLRKPIVLVPNDQSQETRVFKIIENDRVIIIRNGERYDMTGKRMEK